MGERRSGAADCVGSTDRAAPASKHYAALNPEPIDVIEGWGLNYRTGNAIKYIARAGKKDPSKTAEDYRKAIAYLHREINYLVTGSPGW